MRKYRHTHLRVSRREISRDEKWVTLQLIGQFPYGKFAPGGIKHPKRIRISLFELDTRYQEIENG